MGVGGAWGGGLIFKNPSFNLFKLNKGEIKIKLPKIKKFSPCHRGQSLPSFLCVASFLYVVKTTFCFNVVKSGQFSASFWYMIVKHFFSKSKCHKQ